MKSLILRSCISILISSICVFSQSSNNYYSFIYSAKKCQFIYIIDSIISNNSNYKAQKFALYNKNLKCHISIQKQNIQENISTKNIINLIDFLDYKLFVMSSYPYSSPYILKYKQRYYGFDYRISNLFLHKIKKQKLISKIKFGGYWCFHIKDGILLRYQFDPIGYEMLHIQ